MSRRSIRGFEQITLNPMPREFPAWCSAAKALMLLTYSELEVDQFRFPDAQRFDGSDFRAVIGATALKYDAYELGSTLVQLEDTHLKFLLAQGSREFVGIDSSDPPEIIYANIVAGRAGVRSVACFVNSN